MELVAAKCPSCGADIQVPNNKDFAFCTFCGSNVKVRESVIMKSDVDTDNLLSLGNVELTAKDYNEAMDYFTRVLEADGKNHRAWLGRGQSTIRKSNTGVKLYEEAFVYFENALNNCPESESEILIDTIISEFTAKKFYSGHIEVMDRLLKLKPEKQVLLQLISLLDIVEEEAGKSGNKLSLSRQTIKNDALALLKENYPEEYNKYIRRTEKKIQGIEKQSEDNAAREIERKQKDIFSTKRFIKDLFLTSLLSVILAGLIVLILDGIGIMGGFARLFVIFIVIAGFLNLSVFMNKRRELKAFKEQISLKSNPFKNMVQ